jgi:hypothetical protein
VDWQIGSVILIVGVAVVYLVHSAWRTLTGKKTGCSGGCRCDAKERRPDANGHVNVVPVQDLTLRRRTETQ